jgi:hypothetical protein
MSKIFKVEMYIDNICNENYENVEDIINDLENESLFVTLIKHEEKDTTEYMDKIEDDYAWNTTDDKKRLEALNNYFKE